MTLGVQNRPFGDSFLSTPHGNPSKNYLLGLVIAVLSLTGILVVWFDLALVGMISPERVVSGSNLIVQLDSFLGGGYLAGFFLYANTLFQQRGWFPRRISSFLIAPFVATAISGLFGMMATLTGAVTYLELASIFLCYVIILIVSNVYRFHLWYQRPE